MDIDFFTKCEVEDNMHRIERLINSGIFNEVNSGNLFVKSAFIDVLICLRNLMSKSSKYSEPISFTNDVIITQKVKNVSELIKFVRDALCHPESINHLIPNTSTKASFNIVYGKGCILKIGEVTQNSEYDDDVCFFFGEQRIYLMRHIIKAFNMAKQNLLPLVR